MFYRYPTDPRFLQPLRFKVITLIGVKLLDNAYSTEYIFTTSHLLKLFIIKLHFNNVWIKSIANFAYSIIDSYMSSRFFSMHTLQNSSNLFPTNHQSHFDFPSTSEFHCVHNASNASALIEIYWDVFPTGLIHWQR